MEFPKRKPTRLKEYDYSQNGAYFVTICTRGKKCILSDIIVGQGLAPAETNLSQYGKIAEEQLLALKKRYKTIEIDKYVIMPNHIHIIIISNKTAGACPCRFYIQKGGLLYPPLILFKPHNKLHQSFSANRHFVSAVFYGHCLIEFFL